MSTPLGEVFAEVADQARNYADPDRAIGAVRRRRRRRLGAAAPSHSPSWWCSRVLPWYARAIAARRRWRHRPVPPSVTPVREPAGRGRPAVAHRPGGRAGVVPLRAVRRSGVLPAVSGAAPSSVSSCSWTRTTPSRRTVATSVGMDVHGYHVRDLLRTRELPVTVDGAESSRFFGVARSPSSSRLLVGAGIDAPSRYAVATADGSRPPIQVPSLATAGLDERPVGLLDSGYLITLRLDGSGAIRLRSPSSLALLRTIVDGDAGIRAHLRPGEYLGSTVLLYPCGCQLAIGVGRPVDPPLRMPPGGVSTGFVAVDLNDGHVTGRVDLPVPPSGRGRTRSGSSRRSPRAASWWPTGRRTRPRSRSATTSVVRRRS